MSIPNFKIALVGGPNVGKTTMITYFTTHHFVETVNTVQASRVSSEIRIQDELVRLDIWDTAGQERYRAVGPQFFRNAVACIGVYDLTRPESLSELEGYLADYKNCFEAGGYVVIAGNKSDLITDDLDEVVKPGTYFAQERNTSVFVTSAKTGLGIDELFGDVALHLVENPPDKPQNMQLASMEEDDCPC
jgi:small GTP-binding protein